MPGFPHNLRLCNQEYHSSDMMSSVRRYQEHVGVWPVAGKAHVNPLAKVLSARFLRCDDFPLYGIP